MPGRLYFTVMGGGWKSTCWILASESGSCARPRWDHVAPVSVWVVSSNGRAVSVQPVADQYRVPDVPMPE